MSQRFTFLANGKSAAYTGLDGQVILWNLEDGKVIRQMNHPGGIYSIINRWPASGHGRSATGPSGFGSWQRVGS